MRKTRISFLVVALVGACLMLASCAQPQVEQPVEYNKPQALASAADTVRTGKDQVTVLVLNGCGIEGAAEEAAEKIKNAGFTNVTVENSTYFNKTFTNVSYRYEEQWPEVQEIMSLFDLDDPEGMYRYDTDAGGWGKEYDILLMLGDPDGIGYSGQNALPSAEGVAS